MKSVYLVTSHAVDEAFEQPDKLPAQFGAWVLHSTAAASTDPGWNRQIMAVWVAQVEGSK